MLEKLDLPEALVGLCHGFSGAAKILFLAGNHFITAFDFLIIRRIGQDGQRQDHGNQYYTASFKLNQRP